MESRRYFRKVGKPINSIGWLVSDNRLGAAYRFTGIYCDPNIQRPRIKAKKRKKLNNEKYLFFNYVYSITPRNGEHFLSENTKKWMVIKKRKNIYYFEITT